MMWRLPTFCLSVFLVAGIARPLFAPLFLPKDFDQTPYDDLLRAYVNEKGAVDYDGLRTNAQSDLQDHLDRVAKADLKQMSYEQKLAFWINAYNAHVLQYMLNHPDLKKINPHGGMFDQELRIAEGDYSLNDLLHRIIRGKMNEKTLDGPISNVTLEIFDPRVHFALSNGSVGGPVLRNVAYTAKNLETSLRQASVNFVNNPRHLRWEKGKLKISSLMNWYTEDFTTLGGPGVYLSRLLDPKLRKDADILKAKLLTEYTRANFEYDWRVNALQ